MGKKRVMIVDDTGLSRLVIHNTLLTHPQISVVGCAANGREALVMHEATKPDLMILDINMPEMDGIEVLKKLLLDSTTKVLVLTGNERKMPQARSLGAHDYMIKGATSGIPIQGPQQNDLLGRVCSLLGIPQLEK